MLKAVLDRTKIDPKLIDDVAVGTVLPKGGGAIVSRMASLAAGIPDTAALNTVNRQCSSGLAATVQIANQIAMGQIEIGIGAGVESMTTDWENAGPPEKMSEVVTANEAAQDCLTPMGITSENVAKEFGISRKTQDEFAAHSHKKAGDAQKAGYFKDEIIPVTTTVSDKEGNEKEVTVTEDDGIRRGVTAESLGKLRASFSEDGSTTAGNASQVSDGAAAVLLMKRKTAQKLGLKPIGKFVTAAVKGVPPRIMGIGPAFAIPAVLNQAGISKDDVDVYEINEAFASQATYSVDKVGINPEKVNPLGGAIAFGHPLGATGARQIATGIHQLQRTGQNVLVTSMCIGTGMGMASIWTRE